MTDQRASGTDVDMSVDLCGIRLKNPVIAASGTFGFGREYARLYDISMLGGISVKGLTLLPRSGNPSPRIAETSSGILNSVGLQNPGVDAFLQNELPWLLHQKITVFANIAGASTEDYARIAEKIGTSNISFIELNISCPNVKAGGVAFGARPEGVREITSIVRARVRQKLVVKLTPNTADIAEAALAAEEAGADAVSLINTITGMAVDAHRRKPILANVTGGLSGPAIKPVALRMVYQASHAVRIPVIGMGGIMSGRDAAEFLLCGASAVQVGTANLCDPLAAPRIIEELRAFLREEGVSAVSELIGALEVE